jgi:putative DNA primase/helicase
MSDRDPYPIAAQAAAALDAHLAANGSSAELFAQHLHTQRVPLRALNLTDMAHIEFRQREPLLAPWLCTQDLAMVFAPRGIGKTHFAMSVAYAVASGGSFAKWQAPQPQRVLYLDGELPGSVMKSRLAVHLPDQPFDPDNLRTFTPDLLADDHALPDLSTRAGQAEVEPMLQDAKLVVVDNLSAWARTGNENEAESWLTVSEWLLSLRRRGMAVLLVHHANKNGQQRGTSKREDLLDVVIKMARPADYDPKQGAVFEAEFTKARHLMGTDAETLEMTLAGEETQAVWTWRTAENGTYSRVLRLAKEGLTPAEICEELDIHKSRVSRHLRRARESGELSAADVKGAAS